MVLLHHKTQGVEQLGISLQQLGRKAFPSMSGKVLDRLLKGGGGGRGGFFQALNVKWQHRLGAPRPDETFYTLYDRARALSIERSRSILDRTPSGDYQQKPVRKEQKSSTKGSSGEGGNLKSHKKVIRHRGDNVKKVGHIARNCLHSVESPGRRLNASVTTSTNTVGRIQPVLPD